MRARPVTMPRGVRSAWSVSLPAGVESARLGCQLFVFWSTSMAWHEPRYEKCIESTVGLAPPGSQSGSAQVSAMSCPAEVALQA